MCRLSLIGGFEVLQFEAGKRVAFEFGPVELGPGGMPKLRNARTLFGERSLAPQGVDEFLTLAITHMEDDAGS